MLRSIAVLVFEMLRYHRWCTPLNFMRLFLAAHFRRRNRICRLSLRKIKHPVYVRARTSDCFLVRTIFIKVGGEYPVFADYAPKVIIDAGANIGLATVFFKSYYPDTIVIAIEPDDDNCRMFALNTGAYDDVHLLQGGLWPDEGQQLRIKNPSEAPWQFQCEVAATGKPAFSVDAICSRFNLLHIDIMKIDIEGNERELFSRNTAWLHKTDNIFIELHDHLAPGASASFLQAIAAVPFSVRMSGENLILTKAHLAIANKWNVFPPQAQQHRHRS